MITYEQVLLKVNVQWRGCWSDRATYLLDVRATGSSRFSFRRSNATGRTRVTRLIANDTQLTCTYAHFRETTVSIRVVSLTSKILNISAWHFHSRSDSSLTLTRRKWCQYLGNWLEMCDVVSGQWTVVDIDKSFTRLHVRGNITKPQILWAIPKLKFL